MKTGVIEPSTAQAETAKPFQRQWSWQQSVSVCTDVRAWTPDRAAQSGAAVRLSSLLSVPGSLSFLSFKMTFRFREVKVSAPNIPQIPRNCIECPLVTCCWETAAGIKQTHTSRSSTWRWRCAGTADWFPRWCPGRSRAQRGRRRAEVASYSGGLGKKTAGQWNSILTCKNVFFFSTMVLLNYSEMMAFLWLYCIFFRSISLCGQLLQAPGPRLCDCSSRSLLSRSWAFFSSSSCFLRSSAVVAFTAV